MQQSCLTFINVCRINLAHNSLSNPQELAVFRGTVELDVSENKFSVLDDLVVAFNSFDRLESLDLRRNPFYQ